MSKKDFNISDLLTLPYLTLTLCKNEPDGIWSTTRKVKTNKIEITEGQILLSAEYTSELSCALVNVSIDYLGHKNTYEFDVSLDEGYIFKLTLSLVEDINVKT